MSSFGGVSPEGFIRQLLRAIALADALGLAKIVAGTSNVLLIWRRPEIELLANCRAL